MSQRFGNIIRVLGSQIPVRSGTNLYVGFEALQSCHGKPYEAFRRLAGGPKGSSGRRFSPSTVWKRAVECRFAEFEGGEGARSVPNPSSVPRAQSSLSSVQVGKLAPQPPSYSGSRPRSLNSVRRLVVASGASLDRPGIYAWKIEGGAVYVGKYTHGSRPLQEYEKNVRRLLAGEPYRPQKPDGFRRIHRALARALQEGRQIELHIVENCSPDLLNIRERFWISAISRGGLNG